MHPILIDVFGFPIYSYGAMLLLSFALSIALAVHLCKRYGNPSGPVIELSLWAILMGILGSRLGYVLQNLPYYMDHPVSIINLREGGMTIITGVILAAVALVWYFRKRDVPVMNVLDVLSGPTLVGMGVGRLGCLLHGCCYGRLCEASWGITYPVGSLGAGVPGGPRYPVPLMEMGLDFLLLALVLWYLPRSRFAGQTFWLTFGGYAIIRFAVEFFREGGLLGPFSLAQWTSVLFLLVSVLGFAGIFGKQPIDRNMRLEDTSSPKRAP
ncbi:MAG: prolipoprotein diacylglyceryl transferase [Armatimonadetes bacterium]|nr:prolipoprotein diacylglyceryl transferase [Armatimonadota bacterium]